MFKLAIVSAVACSAVNAVDLEADLDADRFRYGGPAGRRGPARGLARGPARGSLLRGRPGLVGRRTLSPYGPPKASKALPYGHPDNVYGGPIRKSRRNPYGPHIKHRVSKSVSDSESEAEAEAEDEAEAEAEVEAEASVSKSPEAKVKVSPIRPTPEGVGIRGLPPKRVRVKADAPRDLRGLRRGAPTGASRELGSIRGGRYGPNGGKFGPRGNLNTDRRTLRELRGNPRSRRGFGSFGDFKDGTRRIGADLDISKGGLRGGRYRQFGRYGGRVGGIATPQDIVANRLGEGRIARGGRLDGDRRGGLVRGPRSWAGPRGARVANPYILRGDPSGVRVRPSTLPRLGRGRFGAPKLIELDAAHEPEPEEEEPVEEDVVEEEVVEEEPAEEEPAEEEPAAEVEVEVEADVVEVVEEEEPEPVEVEEPEPVKVEVAKPLYDIEDDYLEEVEDYIEEVVPVKVVPVKVIDKEYIEEKIAEKVEEKLEDIIDLSASELAAEYVPLGADADLENSKIRVELIKAKVINDDLIKQDLKRDETIKEEMAIADDIVKDEEKDD